MWAIKAGMRESTQSWREVWLNLKARGLTAAAWAIGAGALGLLGGAGGRLPQPRAPALLGTQDPACPPCATEKSVQPQAKQALQDIGRAETKGDAERTFEGFLNTDAVKYPNATTWLEKDRDE